MNDRDAVNESAARADEDTGSSQQTEAREKLDDPAGDKGDGADVTAMEATPDDSVS